MSRGEVGEVRDGGVKKCGKEKWEIEAKVN